MGARLRLLAAAAENWTLASLPPLLLLLLASVRTSRALVEKECRLDFFRLPERVQPTSYKLFIKPDLNESVFSATLTIQLLVHEQDSRGSFCGPPPANEREEREEFGVARRRKKKAKTKKEKKKKKWRSRAAAAAGPDCDRSKIVLHAHQDLKIEELHFQTDDNRLVQVRELCRDFKNELLVVGLSAPLDRQTAGRLQVRFAGPIRSDLHGFFRSEHNSGRRLAVTHFQPAHARKTFPCFDEPNFKSNFELIIEHAAHLTALSNMHVIRRESVRYKPAKIQEAAAAADQDEEEEEEEEQQQQQRQAEFTRVHFAQTPRMSTYLLAFAVGEFDHIESRSGQLKIGIWTAPGRAKLAHFALRSAVSAYGALRQYFNIEQPLEKIDFVAVAELDAGAMENWGLITVTERFLLLNEHNTTPEDIHYATDSITHELSHQWFGNLVTMSWWDDLWLNEGFATWITQLINQQLAPAPIDGELIYLMDALNVALNSDSSRRTHPIRNAQLSSAKEIELAFDDITYEKASAVIRMLNDFMGARQFQLAIRSYLRAHSLGNARALDLWTALEATSKLELRPLITSWIDQPGFPLIRAQLSANGRTLRLNQERFLERPGALPEPAQANGTALNKQELPLEVDKQLNLVERPQKWIVPLAMWISNGRDKTKLFRVLMSKRAASVELPHWFDARQPGHWLKLNANFSGFYRVSYDDLRLFKALQQPIERQLLGPSDRLQFISDTFALLANERLDMFQFDQALSWFRAEDNDALLDVLARYIASLEAHHYPSGWNRTKLLLDFYLREGKFAPNRTNSWLRVRARATVASSLVLIQNQLVTRDAIHLFERAGGLGVPASFRLPVFSAVARDGSPEQLEQLIKLVQQLDSGHSQARLAEAMAGSLAGTAAPPAATQATAAAAAAASGPR